MTLEEKIAELKVGDKIKFEGQEYIVINRKRNKLDLKAGTLSRKISVEELIEKLKNLAKVEEVSQEEIAKIVGSEEEKEDPNRKTYKNYPYNFVSLGDKNKVERKPYSDSIGNNSGKLICSLVNKTPIFTNGKTKKIDVKDERNGKTYKHSLEDFLEDNGKYLITSSSLKGEIRNIIEIITNSCIKNVESEKLNRKDFYTPLDLTPEEFRPCKNIENLCFACRMFGSTGDQKSVEDENISCIGKVYFTDATIDKKKAKIVADYVPLKALGTPHPTFTRFYLKDRGSYKKEGSTIRGRKFYWHHRDKINGNENSLNSIRMKGKNESDKRKKFNASLKFLKPDNKFEFEVSFKNLTDEELGVLIYSLELENNLLHKFGKAKAFGFGSSKITIEKFLLDSKDKYRSFTKTYDEGNKEKYLKIAKDKYLDENRNEIRELKAILNIVNDLDFSNSPFPDINWFSKNKDVYLAEILEKVK